MEFRVLCDVVPCNKKAKVGPNGKPNGKGMCSMHYQRSLKNGSPYVVWIPTVGCSVDGCEEKHYGNGLCNKHYMRVWKNGTIETLIKIPGHEDPSYDTMHKRVMRSRGKASQYSCVDCGEQAYHWSYNHQGEIERSGPGVGSQKKYIFTYSTNIEDYDPRCVPCHKQFDLEVAVVT